MTKYYFVKKITFHLYCALLKNYGLLLHNIKVKSLAWKISAFRGGERSCLRLSYSLFKGLPGYFIGYLRNLQAGNLFSSASSDDALQNRIFLILILFALRSFRLSTVSVSSTVRMSLLLLLTDYLHNNDFNVKVNHV